ncbi:MAG: hypothetical protein KDD51_14155 [Bdellovibrionales bacterium]|nr:hypothetical protein [Bdellovibrionales bacterium]
MKGLASFAAPLSADASNLNTQNPPRNIINSFERIPSAVVALPDLCRLTIPSLESETYAILNADREAELRDVASRRRDGGVCSLLMVAVLVPWDTDAWPKTPAVWGLLVAAGTLAAFGQYTAAVAFRLGPASKVAAASSARR